MVSMFLRVISFVKVTPGVHSPSCLMSFLTWKNSSSRDSVKHVSSTCPLASWETLLVDTSKAINNVWSLIMALMRKRGEIILRGGVYYEIGNSTL